MFGDCEDSSPNEEGTFCFDEGFCMFWWRFDAISNMSSTLRSCWAAGLKWGNFNRTEALPFLLWDDFGAQFSLSSISLYATETSKSAWKSIIPFPRMWEKEDYTDYLSLSSFLFILMEMNNRINWWLINEFYLSLSVRKNRNWNKTFYLYICVFQENFLIPA